MKAAGELKCIATEAGAAMLHATKRVACKRNVFLSCCIKLSNDQSCRSRHHPTVLPTRPNLAGGWCQYQLSSSKRDSSKSWIWPNGHFSQATSMSASIPIYGFYCATTTPASLACAEILFLYALMSPGKCSTLPLSQTHSSLQTFCNIVTS